MSEKEKILVLEIFLYMTKKKVISLKKQITTVVAIVAFIASFTTGLDRIRGWFKKNEESKIHQKYINQ